jgi:hypothetical protein
MNGAIGEEEEKRRIAPKIISMNSIGINHHLFAFQRNSNNSLTMPVLLDNDKKNLFIFDSFSESKKLIFLSGYILYSQGVLKLLCGSSIL